MKDQVCDVIFLVRLQGKFETDHSWEQGSALSFSSLSPVVNPNP